MFKNFHGFHLVESYHNSKGQKRFRVVGFYLIEYLYSVVI